MRILSRASTHRMASSKSSRQSCGSRSILLHSVDERFTSIWDAIIPTSRTYLVHARFDPEKHRNRTVKPAWIWWASVCHQFSSLCDDQCRDSCSLLRATGFFYQRIMPKRCFIGVMGWLLTSRQAWVFLFITNQSYSYAWVHDFVQNTVSRLITIKPGLVLMRCDFKLCWRNWRSLSHQHDPYT